MKGRIMPNDGDFSPQLKEHITRAFNEGLRQLICSVYGIMPDEAIVLNVVASLCVARGQNGFTNEENRDAIIAALNTHMAWSAKFGGKNVK
jgi:hypothetical protein